MGIVNDLLPEGVFGDARHQPRRESRFQLGYAKQLNVARELLDRHLASGFRDRPAIRFRGQTLTYGVLAERVNRLSNALTHHGITPGTRVLIHLPNTLEFMESWLASVRIGAIVVATMPALKQRELEQIIGETEPRCLVTTPELLPVFGECGDLPELRIVVGGHGRSPLPYEECITAGSSVHDPAPTAEDDVAIIAYTSGSTGHQKGTIHTHSDVLAIADTYARGILAPTMDDCFAGHSPMAFTYGLGGLLVFPLRFGASTVIDSSPFDPGRWLDIVSREKVTLLFATPTAARLYLEEQTCGNRMTWRSVRAVVSAGEPLTKATFDRWRKVTGTEILDGCGSTEMLHIWISQRPRRATGGCTGWPVPFYQARLEDEKGHEVREDEAEGIVSLQGPTGCRYWCQPELQVKTVRDGWTSTGDRFRRDGEGRYWFVGRTDDMIVSAGYKVSPVEVQEVLLGCPAIREAAVVGVPDEIRGQVVRACVTLKSGFLPGETLAHQVRESVKQRMAAFKCPREIIFLEELPRTSTGKVDRRRLREIGGASQ